MREMAFQSTSNCQLPIPNELNSDVLTDAELVSIQTCQQESFNEEYQALVQEDRCQPKASC
jgi:hypothetical protein